MKAVILAAGPEKLVEENIPKCLITVNGKSILERQIKILKDCGVEDIVVVAGGKGDCWNDSVYRKIKNIHRNMIINNENTKTKNGYSLYLAIKNMKKGPILAIDGDVVFKKESIMSLLNNKHKSAIISRVATSPAEAWGIVVLDDKKAVKIGERVKSKFFPWNIYSGIAKIGNDIFSDLKKELSEKKNERKYLGNVLNKICKKHEIYNVDPDELKKMDGPLVGGSYANTKKVVLIRKEVTGFGKEKLIDEIKWLKNLPKDIKPHFSEIKNYNIKSDPVYFEMPYYKIPSLRKLLLRGEIDSKKALRILERIMDFMFKKVYRKRVGEADEGYVKRIHVERIRKRLEETRERSKIMKRIIDAKYVNLNGRRSLNILQLLKRIENDQRLLKVLQPPGTSMVHGDLHFDNMLVDLTEKDINFVLVDPRGVDKKLCLTYDLGKLWHSFYGLYDFIHDGIFELKYSIKNNEVRANLKINKCPALKEYKKINKEFPKILEKYDLLKKDSSWKLRTLLSNVSHFCSMMPFHLKMDGKEKRAIAIYLRGVYLINEFIDIWSKSKWKGELPHETWININTAEDYEKAKGLFGKRREK